MQFDKGVVIIGQKLKVFNFCSDMHIAFVGTPWHGNNQLVEDTPAGDVSCDSLPVHFTVKF